MTLRMRVLPRFPASIWGSTGIAVSRQAGSADMSVAFDVSQLVRIPAVADNDKVFFTVWNSDLNLYSIMSFNDTFAAVVDSAGFMLKSVYDPQEIEGDVFARANHTGQQAISTITGLQAILDGLATRVTQAELATAINGILADPWALQPIGVPIPSDLNLGIAAPPKDKAYRYVLLSAGQTGSGAYNEGILTTETVTGSDPTINATAVVSLSGSPLNGSTIRLLNTERRYLRSGSPGTLRDSQNLAHTHGVTDPGHVHGISQYWQNSSSSAYAVTTSTPGLWMTPLNPVSATTGISIQSNGGTEARGREIGANYVMRIK